MKGFLKKWIKKTSPLAISKNHHYDILTERIIKKYCEAGSNCIDVGAHEGEILDIFLKNSSRGIHFAFEPIPDLHAKLVNRYKKNSNCKIYDYALSNKEGETEFNYVVSNPAYSGIKKRNYDRKNEKDESLIVKVKKLDNVIPDNIKIDFIKIDVEGGEFDVMLGAKNLIEKHHPLIVFEFGIGGSDIYGVTPEKIYCFMNSLGYDISLLNAFVKKGTSLSEQDFTNQFNNKINYYFIAHPKSKMTLL